MIDIAKLTDEDVDMINYFWTEKHDLERWTKWNERFPVIKKAAPDLIIAYKNYKFYKKVVDALIRNL